MSLGMASLVKGALEGLFHVFKYRGNVQKVRKFIRQHVLAPRIHDRTLHKREVAVEVANEMLAAAYQSHQGAASLISGAAWWLLKKTQFQDKIDLIADVLQRQAENLYEFTEVRLDRDDLAYKFDAGKDDVEKFIKRLLSIIGG